MTGEVKGKSGQGRRATDEVGLEEVKALIRAGGKSARQLTAELSWRYAPETAGKMIRTALAEMRRAGEGVVLPKRPQIDHISPTHKSIGARIYAHLHLQREELSEQDFASAAGLGTTYYLRRVQQGRVDLTLSQVQRIAGVMNVGTRRS